MENILNRLNCITQNQLEKYKLGKNKEKKIIKISNFISKNFRHYYHAFNFRKNYFEQTNIFKLINIYGYGNCIHYTILFAFLMDILKVKNELIFLKYKKKKFSHLVNIIYLDKKKFWIDLDHGIFKYQKKLIPYTKIKEVILKTKILETNYKKKFLDNINLYKDKEIFKYRWKHLKDSYLRSINESQNFNLYEKKFQYKVEMKKFYSKNYFFSQPLFFVNQSNKFYTKKNSFGFVDGKIKKINKYKFENKIIKFNNIHENDFILNNFPFPITNIKINTIDKSKIKLYFLNYKIKNNSNFSFANYIAKKNITDPIYSFKTHSKSKIKNIEVQFLISNFRLKFFKFFNSLLT